MLGCWQNLLGCDNWVLFRVIDIPEKSKSHKKFKQNNKSAGMNRIWGEMWITLNNNSHLEDI